VDGIAICTDSSALMSASTAASLAVDVVRLAVTLDGEPFDEVMSSLDWFYERLRAGATSETAEPSTQDLLAAYERATDRGAETVVSIHPDARISGIATSAEAAAAAASLPVFVVDTRTVGYGVGLCVRAAAAALASGGAAGDATRAASRLGASIQNAFVVRSGPGTRVSPDEGWTAFRYEYGAPVRLSVHGTHTEAVAELVDLVVGTETQVAAAIGHAAREVEPAADELARRLTASGAVAESERYRLGAAAAAVTGPDCLGLVWWPA
jgi:fatty acid-binding protein DegV